MAKEEEAKNTGHEAGTETTSGSAETSEERLAHDLTARIEAKGEQEVVSGLSIEADAEVAGISTESETLRNRVAKENLPPEEIAGVVRETTHIDEDAKSARDDFEKEVLPRKQLSPEQKAKSSERGRTYQEIIEQRTQEFGFPSESAYNALLSEANLLDDDFSFGDVAPYLVETLKLNDDSVEARQLRDQLRAAVLEDRKKLYAIYHNPEKPDVWGNDHMTNPRTEERRQRDKQEAARQKRRKESGVREMDHGLFLSERGFDIPYFPDAQGLEKLFASLVDVDAGQIKQCLVEREGSPGFEEALKQLSLTLETLDERIREQMQEQRAGDFVIGLADELKQKYTNTLREIQRQHTALQEYLRERGQRLGGNPDRKRIGGESD